MAPDDERRGEREGATTTDAAAPDVPASGPVPVLVARKCSKWFGDVIAVNDLDLEVKPGITGLLGPNGAGKTTLIRMAMGLQRPSAGDITVLGEDPWDNAGLLRRIGYVPDGDAPWKEMTGLKAVTFGARLSGIEPEPAKKAAAKVLDQVGLSGAADRRVADYSRGMRQRLKFALALVHEPDLLILDEPLIGTDPLTRKDLVALVRRLADDGKSILLSTHVLPDVEAMTQRIALMAHGRLLAHGEVGEIRDLLERFPRTVRVASPSPRETGAALWKLPSVLSVQAEDASVVVRTREPQKFFAELQDAILANGMPFSSVTSLDDNVESIFRYLVNAR